MTLKIRQFEFGTRRAFMVADALVGLFILAMLVSAFAVATNLRQRNAAHLADQRHALHLAEQTLANLQSSNATTQPSESEARISITNTGKQIGNLQWVQITTVYDGRRATLVGLARPNAGTTQPATSQGASR